MIDKIILWNFLLFFGTILTAGFCLFDNTISSVFSCIFIYLISTILLLMLNVEFISLLIVIIYIGAVAILFLFVTFMLGGDPADKSTQKKMKIKQSIIFLAIMKISFLVDFLDVLSDHINIVKKVDITNLYHLYLYSTGERYEGSF